MDYSGVRAAAAGAFLAANVYGVAQARAQDHIPERQPLVTEVKPVYHAPMSGDGNHGRSPEYGCLGLGQRIGLGNYNSHGEMADTLGLKRVPPPPPEQAVGRLVDCLC